MLALPRPCAPPGCASSASEVGSALWGWVSVLRPAAVTIGVRAGELLGSGDTGVFGVNRGEVVPVYLPLHSLTCPLGV